MVELVIWNTALTLILTSVDNTNLYKLTFYAADKNLLLLVKLENRSSLPCRIRTTIVAKLILLIVIYYRPSKLYHAYLKQFTYKIFTFVNPIGNTRSSGNLYVIYSNNNHYTPLHNIWILNCSKIHIRQSSGRHVLVDLYLFINDEFNHLYRSYE